jgi:hypothetical protein
MSRSPKYWPLITFAAVFVLLGLAGLVLDDGLDEPTRRGVPMGFVYGAMIVSGVGLIGVAVWSRHRRRGGLSPKERQQAEANRKHHKAMARYYLYAAGVATVLLAVIGVLALLDA